MEITNVFDLLEKDYKTEFNKIYKKLSYQMFYGEANILYRVLTKQPCLFDYDLKWYQNFIDWLGVDYKYNFN